jgi:glycosyltransferase involved in cell wall biosynthesis
MAPSSPIAIVICSRDRARLLEGALKAIVAARRPGDETIVVDSASRDPSVGEVAASFEGVTLIRSVQPGLALARNVGVRASRAPLIAFTDDDCRPEPSWAEATEAAFGADSRLGFITGRVRADRTVGPMLAVGGDESARVFRFGDDPADFGHGANFAVRREALEAIGGFDEVLGVGRRFPGAEDHDAFWRILRAGWTGRYEPASIVVHCQWRTRRQYLRSEYGYGLGSGAFAVKAMRLDGRAGRRILRRRLWDHAVLAAARSLRNGSKTGTAGSTLRLAGSLVGVVRALPLRVDDGRYVAT